MAAHNAKCACVVANMAMCSSLNAQGSCGKCPVTLCTILRYHCCRVQDQELSWSCRELPRLDIPISQQGPWLGIGEEFENTAVVLIRDVGFQGWKSVLAGHARPAVRCLAREGQSIGATAATRWRCLQTGPPSSWRVSPRPPTTPASSSATSHRC